MRCISAVMLVLLIAANGVSASVIEKHYQEKPIKIQKAGPFEHDKQVKIRIGEKVRFTIKIYQDMFFNYTIINANANIDNASGQKVKAVYNVSFHDKDGKLVGCHQGSWELKNNEDVNYGSAIIHVRGEDIARVTHYKLKTEVIPAKKKK